jgi:hypothetical protein
MSDFACSKGNRLNKKNCGYWNLTKGFIAARNKCPDCSGTGEEK